MPTACDCARRDHSIVVDRVARVVLPIPVPAPTITMPNPAWHMAIIDVASQLAMAAGDPFVIRKHVVAAEHLLTQAVA